MTRELTIPTTGEVLDLETATTTDVALELERVDDVIGQLDEARADLKAELIARLDRSNRRSAEVGDWRLETNAPTSEQYDVDALARNLEPLVGDGKLDARRSPTSSNTPEAEATGVPTVDKRALNTLKRHPDPRVVRAIAQARTIVPNRRTLKLTPRGEATR
jgi:hypothetical protein